MVTANDIAASDVVTAARNDTLSEVAETMGSEHVGSVVAEEESLPVGIITDRQIALGLADDPAMGHETVDERMTRDVETIHESTTIFQAAQTLSEGGSGGHRSSTTGNSRASCRWTTCSSSSRRSTTPPRTSSRRSPPVLSGRIRAEGSAASGQVGDEFGDPPTLELDLLDALFDRVAGHAGDVLQRDDALGFVTGRRRPDDVADDLRLGAVDLVRVVHRRVQEHCRAHTGPGLRPTGHNRTTYVLTCATAVLTGPNCRNPHNLGRPTGSRRDDSSADPGWRPAASASTTRCP